MADEPRSRSGYRTSSACRSRPPPPTVWASPAGARGSPPRLLCWSQTHRAWKVRSEPNGDPNLRHPGDARWSISNRGTRDASRCTRVARPSTTTSTSATRAPSSGSTDPPLPRIPRVRSHLRHELHGRGRQDHRAREARGNSARGCHDQVHTGVRGGHECARAPSRPRRWCEPRITSRTWSRRSRASIDKGLAYEADGDVWFAVEKFDGYGKLSGRSLDDMRAGERIEPSPGQAQPARLRLVEGRQGGRTCVGVSVGAGSAWVAHRVLGHVDQVPRDGFRHPRRRAAT